MSSGKKKKNFTIMIVPHSEQETISYNIPLWGVQGLVCLLIVGAVLIGSFGLSYRKILLKSAIADRLISENQIQKEQIYFLAQETNELSEKMASLQELDTSLRRFLGIQPADTQTISVGQNELPVGGDGADDYLNVLPETIQDTIRIARQNITDVRANIASTGEDLRDLHGTIEEQRERLAKTPTIWPVQGRVSSNFGWRRSPFGWTREFHYGLDIAAPLGTPVYAAADGRVIYAASRSGYGNFVKINHDYGIITAYAHMSRIVVRYGEKVTKGQVIGYVGDSGRATGYHLHYEVRVNGIRVDPYKYLPNR